MMDADDRALMESSLTAAIEPLATAEETAAALDALGWSDILGAGEQTAIGVVFSHLGRCCAPSAALDDLLTAVLGLPPRSAIVHPAWGSSEPPTAGSDTTAVDGIAVDGTALAHRHASESTWVIYNDRVAAVASEALSVAATGADGGLVEVTSEAAKVQEWRQLGADEVSASVSVARLAIGRQLHGLASGMLELARTHALDRVQFGRPIASFQAVRHKLAETLVEVTAAGEALAAAEEESSAELIDLARILAGRAAESASRNGQQVLAGIGFTREHAFHHYLFANLELDGLYGTTGALEAAVGRQLQEQRRSPRLIEL